MAEKKRAKNSARKKHDLRKSNIKKDPSPSQLYSKVTTISESTKTLSKEIKNMTKIFQKLIWKALKTSKEN